MDSFNDTTKNDSSCHLCVNFRIKEIPPLLVLRAAGDCVFSGFEMQYRPDGVETWTSLSLGFFKGDLQALQVGCLGWWFISWMPDFLVKSKEVQRLLMPNNFEVKLGMVGGKMPLAILAQESQGGFEFW